MEEGKETSKRMDFTQALNIKHYANIKHVTLTLKSEWVAVGYKERTCDTNHQHKYQAVIPAVLQ